jgi:CheY-like chemotaxis protein
MNQMSILLVDDDPHACEVMQLVMRHHKLPLTILGDAESALDYLKSNTPDIVIMDIFLPGIDGYQALRRIRQTSLVPDCRFVATTAYYTNDTEQEITKRGFDGYIPKPFDSSQLITYLESIVDRPHSS